MNTCVVRRAQPWLGTLVSIDVVAERAAQDVTAAFAGAFAAVERVHMAMSLQNTGSDIARFNRALTGEIVTCDPWTIRVLRIALRLHEESSGLFDVALGTTQGPAYRVVDARRLQKIAAASRLDVGGIAKGFAVDRAVLALRAGGIARGLVNAGGDLRAFGVGAWPIAVRGADATVVAQFALEGGAVATSQYRRGRSPHHDDVLIAPASAAVHAVDCTITVAAPRCVVADALTKVVALSGDARHPLLHHVGGQAWLH